MDRVELGVALVVFGGLLVGAVVAVGLAVGSSSSHAAGTVETDVVVGHQTGSVVQYGPNGTVRWADATATGYFDVTPLADGAVLAAFFRDGDPRCGPYDAPCARTGFRVVGPDGPEPGTEWSVPVRTATNSEVHDAEVLPGGDVVVADMDSETLRRVDPATGTVRWRWNASDRYDPPADPTRTDWLHTNDVDRIGDRRYLVSVRNANQLLVVAEGRGVVDVVNEAGSPALFAHQHNPQWLGEDRLLVADSGNDRVVELARRGDEWHVVWALGSAEGVAFDWPRDADRLPTGETLITDSRNNRVLLVNDSGHTLARWRTRNLPYEADVVPGGEPVGGPSASAQTAPESTDPDAVPVLTTIEQSARHVVPLPGWVTEAHVLGVLVGVAMALLGGTLLLHVRLFPGGRHGQGWVGRRGW